MRLLALHARSCWMGSSWHFSDELHWCLSYFRFIMPIIRWLKKFSSRLYVEVDSILESDEPSVFFFLFIRSVFCEDSIADRRFYEIGHYHELQRNWSSQLPFRHTDARYCSASVFLFEMCSVFLVCDIRDTP